MYITEHVELVINDLYYCAVLQSRFLALLFKRFMRNIVKHIVYFKNTAETNPPLITASRVIVTACQDLWEYAIVLIKNAINIR